MFISHSKRNTFYWGLADFDSIYIAQKSIVYYPRIVVVLYVLVIGSLSNDHFAQKIELSLFSLISLMYDT